MNTGFKEELLQVFKDLNSFIEDENQVAREEGALPIPPQTIQIVGQTALILAELPFAVTATMDLDKDEKLITTYLEYFPETREKIKTLAGK